MSNYIVKKIYNPKNIEEEIYKFWEKGNYFSPHGNTNKESYCIMMPPPNITGQLHLGHAFQQTIMDSLIRYHRMQGKNTLWQTGIDHAGIATQTLIEKNFSSNHKNINNDDTRNILIHNAWHWKTQSENLINYQMKRLGNSVDWKHKRFTMDKDMSYAVKEAFIKLYQDNLIYKNIRLVNWDTDLQTAISDLEVSNKQIKGMMWYIRYLLDKNNSNTTINKNLKYLIVATTRPETILGDVAVAVHPNDSRYNMLTNQYVITPITNKRIPIIFDKYIDMSKGTGCVKITPGHDFNDYTIGKRHKLSMIKIFSMNGRILKKPKIFNNIGQIDDTLHYNIPKIFHGLNVIQARETIISECKKINLLDSIKSHDINISYNNRTNTIIEPMLTNQWFIRTKNLAQPAINAVKKNIITFIPKQYKNMYFSWMNNVEDWCISRQIWWGHKIPAWYDHANNKIYVGHCEQDIRTKNNLSNQTILHEDTDVLDTWFSSSLWTFSTLGWPRSNNILNIFHPTNVIISGFDIIFFWIARMIMLSMYFIKDAFGKDQIPFKNIYITGLVRDELGRKMSKSKGNTIDPLDIIDGISAENLLKKRTNNIHQSQLIKKIKKDTITKFPNGIKPHGSDALRFTLTALASSGRDVHWDMKRLTGYHNFCNKLWNASLFIINNTKNKDCGIYTKHKMLSITDRWIITKFHQTTKNIHQAFENYRFDKIANILHEFIWHQFCDWYIELTKPIIMHHNTNILQLRGTRYTLITLLESLLKLAHPIIPFITEKIWQKIKNITQNNNKTIMLQSFPRYDKSAIDEKALIDLEWIKHIITSIRTIRANMHIQYNIPLQIIFKNASSNIKQRIEENYTILLHAARISNIKFIKNQQTNSKLISIKFEDTELFILIPKIHNQHIEINKFNKKIELINNKIQNITKILNDINFINKAPTSIITKQKEKLKNLEKIKNTLTNQYTMIKSS